MIPLVVSRTSSLGCKESFVGGLPIESGTSMMVAVSEGACSPIVRGEGRSEGEWAGVTAEKYDLIEFLEWDAAFPADVDALTKRPLLPRGVFTIIYKEHEAHIDEQ